MVDQLSGIAVFVRAAQASSFALAAENMGLSRSAVGKAIARLEERLGVQLFHRTTRSLRLTDEGAAFYERCAGALADIQDAETSFDAVKRQPAGRVRISVPVLLGRHCIAPILVELAAAHPQLELEVAFTDRPVDLLADGFDLVVRTGTLADDDDLKARCLGPSRCCYARRHPTCSVAACLHGWKRLSRMRCLLMARAIASCPGTSKTRDSDAKSNRPAGSASMTWKRSQMLR